MSELKFDPNNYRIHGDKNKRLIQKSLVECGAGRSILFDNDNCIIAGNGVYEQAQELGLKVRVIESDGTELIAIKRTDLTTEDSVMRNCCADPLYNKLSYDTRDVVRSRKFKEVFPEIKLKGDKQNVHEWRVEGTRQVSYFGAGVGGTVIGFGASMLVMTDDLYKSLEDALSDNNNEKTWSWKQGTHASRIEGNCCMIESVLVGRLMTC